MRQAHPYSRPIQTLVHFHYNMEFYEEIVFLSALEISKCALTKNELHRTCTAHMGKIPV